MFDLKWNTTDDQKKKHLLQSRFFYLLSSLIIYFIGTALLSGNKTTNFINTFFLAWFIAVSIYPFVKINGIFFLVTVLALAILGLHFTVIFYRQDEFLFSILYLLCAIFLSIITYAVIYHIIRHKRITVDSLFGAICGYFLIGFTWTFFYLVINVIEPTSFPASMLIGSIHDRTQHFFYFNFTTLTTLGFGDILPLTNIARTFAWLEAVCGQIYLAVWISQLVGLRIAQEINQSDR